MYVDKNIPKLIDMDHQRFDQIFLNLIHNAIKYTDNGKISVQIKFKQGKSTVTDSDFEPIPFSQDGVFEKCLMISRTSKDCVYYNQLLEATMGKLD